MKNDTRQYMGVMKVKKGGGEMRWKDKRREDRRKRESGKENTFDLWQSKSVGVFPAFPWEPALPEH